MADTTIPVTAVGKANLSLLEAVATAQKAVAELSKLENPSRMETVQLRRATSALDAAKANFLLANIKLASSVAKSMTTPEMLSHIGHEEILAAAQEGLILAFNVWDPSKGAFASYATRAIRTTVTTLAARSLSLSRTDYEARGRIVAAVQYLREHNIEPTALAIQTHLGTSNGDKKVPLVQIERVLGFSHALRLDAPVGSEDGATSMASLLEDVSTAPLGDDLTSVRTKASAVMSDVITFTVWMMMSGAHGTAAESSATTAFLTGEPRPVIARRKTAANGALVTGRIAGTTTFAEDDE